MNERLKELAVQAGIYYRTTSDEFCEADKDGVPLEMMERFAELVRQDDRAARGAVLREQDKQIKEMQLIHANLREKFNKAVLEEREACAKLCESMGVYPELNVWNGGPDWYKRQKECAAAIRARGEK